MRRLFLIAAALAATLTTASADYPDRPIRLIVPQAAGSATDNAARLIGAVLSQELGQQVIVENRPGGALTIGLDLVAKSPPDGYTLGMGPIGALAIIRSSRTPSWRSSPSSATSGGSPEDFAATIKADSAKWADVVKRSGAKLD